MSSFNIIIVALYPCNVHQSIKAKDKQSEHKQNISTFSILVEQTGCSFISHTLYPFPIFTPFVFLSLITLLDHLHLHLRKINGNIMHKNLQKNSRPLRNNSCSISIFFGWCKEWYIQKCTISRQVFKFSCAWSRSSWTLDHLTKYTMPIRIQLTAYFDYRNFPHEPS